MFFSKSQNDFRGLYQETVKGLGSYFYKFGVTNRQDLEDLVQETYIEAFKSMDGLKEPKAAKAWLYTIARRQFIRYLETKRKNPKTTMLDEPLHGTFEKSGQSPADQSLYAAFVCKTVLSQLEKIQEETRYLALTKFFVELEPLADISAALGVNISTLTTWCNRFRKELKENLERLNQEAPHYRDLGWRKLFKRARVAA
jgi:RNA polymerase sigma-70 factor, ECF subfamily